MKLAGVSLRQDKRTKSPMLLTTFYPDPTTHTSLRLELETWEALDEICKREKMTLRDIYHASKTIYPQYEAPSAIRMMVLRYFKEASTEAGHRSAGHSSIK